MKKILLIGAAPIAGVMRYPSEGSIEVAPEVADDLVKVGLAHPDDLSTQKVADLRETAQREGANVGPVATKADLVEAINNRRENRA